MMNLCMPMSFLTLSGEVFYFFFNFNFCIFQFHSFPLFFDLRPMVRCGRPLPRPGVERPGVALVVQASSKRAKRAKRS